MNSVRRAVVLILFFATTLFAAPERQVGTPVYAPAPGSRSLPGIASDGQNFLVVWRDERGPAAGLVGTRVTAGGAVVDPTGLRIATGAATHPQVLWTGSEYTVIYETITATAGGLHDIWMVRVTPQGDVSTPRVIAINGVAGGVATNGGVTVVSYAAVGNATGLSTIRAVVLDREGNVVRDSALSTLSGGSLAPPAIASNGREFLVVWNVYRSTQPTIEAVRLDASGVRITDLPVILGHGYDPIVASDGTRYLLVVRILVTGGSNAPAARVVDDSLGKSDWYELPQREIPSSPTLLWNGSRYLIIGELLRPNESELVSGAIGADARPIRNVYDVLRIVPLAGSLLGPGAATSGSNVLIVWKEVNFTDMRTDLGGERLLGALTGAQATGRATAPLVLAQSANRHAAPSIASAGNQHLVSWREASGIYASRLAADGQPLDGRGILIESGNSGNPTVAFDGLQYVIAYNMTIDNQAFAMVRFLTRAGELRPQKLAIAAPHVYATSVALARDDRGTLLLWTERVVRAAHIHRETLTVDIGPAEVLPESAQAGELSAAWNGREYLVVYSEFVPSPLLISPPIYMPARIRATRVTASLVPLDRGTLLVGDHGQEADSGAHVASDGRDWLVVWNDIAAVWSRRVLADGTMPGDVNGTRVSSGWFPDVDWNGASYTVAWKLRGPEGHLVHATIPRAGTPSADGSRLVSTTFSPWSGIDLAATARGPIVTYLKLATGPEFGDVERTFVRLLDDAPLPRMRAVRH